MNNEKWTVVKKGNGKFVPRYSNDFVESHWPFGEVGRNIEFDTLGEAIDCLVLTKKEIDDQRLKSQETIVFEL